MKKIYVYVLLIAFALAACKKDQQVTKGAISVTVVNAVDGTIIAANFAAKPVAYTQNAIYIPYASFSEYGLPDGQTPVLLVSSADTSKVSYSGSIDGVAAGIYSLYYYNDENNKPAGLVLKDDIPNDPDNITTVRFINLSPGNPVSINLQGNPASQTEVASLAFKQITAFKQYSSASALNGTYTFEVRDQASGALLTTYTWNYKGSLSNTIVINGTGGNVSAFQVNNY